MDAASRLVMDTNVVVSALLHPARTPARALAAARRCTVLVDARVEAEYRSVLARKKFASIPVARRDDLLEALLSDAVRVVATVYAGPMVDEDDRMFVEVALAGGADAIVTGNAKHFPSALAVEVIGPAELLRRLEG